MRQCRSVARGAARLCDERLKPVPRARAGLEAARQKLSSGSTTGDKPTPGRGQAAKAPRTANRQRGQKRNHPGGIRRRQGRIVAVF